MRRLRESAWPRVPRQPHPGWPAPIRAIRHAAIAEARTRRAVTLTVVVGLASIATIVLEQLR